MTHKICIIGDSHIAAFKAAWTENSERWPSLDVDVFGAQGDTLAHFYVRKGMFVTDDKERRRNVRKITGQKRLELEQYDALVLTGMQLSVAAVVRLLRTTAHLKQPSSAAVQEDEMFERPLLSNRLVELYMQDRLRQTLFYEVAKNLSVHTKSPETKTEMIVASQPRPASHAISLGKAYNGYRVLKRNDDHGYAEQLFEKYAEDLSHHLGALYLAQPEETREDHLFTAQDYSQGSVQLRAGAGKEHRADDVLHANARYAGVVFDQIAAALGPVE